MAYVERLAAEVEAGRPAAVAKVVSGSRIGEAVVVSPSGLLLSGVNDPGLQAAMADLATQMLADGRSGVQSLPSAGGPVRVYVESYLPAPVLLVVGAGHVGQMVEIGRAHV